jgi:hypothetical protein
MKKSKWFAHIDHSQLMVLREREFSSSIVLTVTKPEFIASIEIKEKQYRPVVAGNSHRRKG